MLGCNRGGEFTSRIFSEYLENAGTARHLTVHDSPASNSAVERENRTHLDGARAMMEAAKLPKNLWAEAINYHVWIHNRTTTCALLKQPKTPIEIATGQKPDLSGIHPWGCKVWVKRLDVGKLDPRAEECRFVNIDSESKGYRVYWPGKNRVSIEKDVYFNESDALEPDEVPIEGGTDILTNTDHHHPSNTPENPQPVKTTPNEQNSVQQTPENVPNEPKIPETNQQPPSQPKQARCNSLEGLPQFSNEQFGRGKCHKVPSSQTSATIADVEEVLDVEEMADVTLSRKGKRSSDQGGVEVDEVALLG